jgi:hypothetical protein
MFRTGSIRNTMWLYLEVDKITYKKGELPNSYFEGR